MCEGKRKYLVFFLVEAVICLFLLLGCFRKEYSVFTAENITLDQESGETIYRSEDIQVRPGVYQVRAKGISQEEGCIYLQPFCEGGSFRSIKANTVPVFAGQKSVDFEIYVREKSDHLSISCNMGEGHAEIESLEVYWTNMGNRMLLFGYIVVALCADFLLVFRRKILEGKISKETQVVFWGLAASIIISYFPYLTDYFSSAADSAFHWLRIEGLKETLLQGNQFPVRVQSYWFYDHGYAVSSFYGDFFLLIPAVLRIIGFSLMTSYKMFVFLVMAATAVIAYYSFKQCTKHCYAALFGSVLYVLAPYRIYNFYNRGAVGEYLAMTFMPLVICGMYRLFTEDQEDDKFRTAKWPLIFGLSAILQAHILSCEMAIVTIMFICLIFYKRTFRKKVFVQLLQAGGICLGLNAWFWVPLLKMMFSDTYYMSTNISNPIQDRGTLLAEVLQLYPNCGSAQTGMYQAEPFQIGVASLLILACIIITLTIKKIFRDDKKKYNAYDKIVLFWAVAILIVWFMSTRYFPWTFLSKIKGVKVLIGALQFPTRLTALTSVFSAAEASFFCLWFNNECRELFTDTEKIKLIKRMVAAGLVILATGSAIYQVNDIACTVTPIWLHNAENMGTISVVNGEYMLEGTKIEDFHYHEPEAEEGLEWCSYEKKGTHISINVNNPTQRERYLELPLTGYKGYEVESVETIAEGAMSPYITEDRGQHGDLRIAIPSGYEGALSIDYKGFASSRIAEAVSILTAVALVACWSATGRKIWKVRNRK